MSGTEGQPAPIEDMLQQTGGNAAEIIMKLGLPRKALYDKLPRHGLDPRKFRDV